MERRAIIILGAGYTGHYLYRHSTASGRSVRVTSRNPHRNLATLPEADRLLFDLGRRETWPAVPSDGAIIWCFPAQPIELVQAFAVAQGMKTRRLVVLGSTSAYARPPSNELSGAPLIDEDAPLDFAQPRVQAEEYLRTACGAIVLRVAGIYGPGRNPLDWIRRGRVRSSERFVNLIHVEDLAAVALELSERGIAGESYNVSDGIPRRWTDICRMAQAHWAVPSLEGQGSTDPGKRVDSAKLRRTLGRPFCHPDLYQALTTIEAPVHPLPAAAVGSS